ncbi:MAG: methylated-DNA-[protein]-cysteine S-methyltransferase [Chloroflexota bacterium]|jgi:methylated-DNA-[protein]-cysteine S-methyltransferase|nr:methylated-DNA-[protein]-cysteine S-methyltransferase [Chloroflexota bacterium]
MTIETVIGDARERLLARAKREGLATIGYDVLGSPLGPLWVAIGPRGVTTIHYGDEPSESELRRLVRVYGPGVVPDRTRSSALARELDEYFNGTRRDFDVAVDLSGLTPFQTRVLAATAKIPFGAVSTYGAVAKRAGNAKASRAAGGALNANPIPIVVPCHRVVGSNGSLVGYAGGLDVKRRLLAIEGADVARRG